MTTFSDEVPPEVALAHWQVDNPGKVLIGSIEIAEVAGDRARIQELLDDRANILAVANETVERWRQGASRYHAEGIAQQ